MTISSTYKKASSEVMARSELSALISLLDDPDDFVQQKVMERLSQLDERSVPLLDEIREGIADEKLRKRLTDLIHKFTFDSFEMEFIEYLDCGVSSVADLEKGQLLLSRFENPTLRTDLYRRQLDKMASRLEPEIRTGLSRSEILQAFVSFFFEKEYFKGAESDYMHPDNSYLHKVLQRRRGIPISLSMVMMFVANRLDLPFFGVNMPMHFMLKYESGNESTLIDPFNGGKVVTLDQCSYFLRNHGIVPGPAHFNKASERDILARSIRNLIFSYEKSGETERSVELKRLLGYIMSIRKI